MGVKQDIRMVKAYFKFGKLLGVTAMIAPGKHETILCVIHKCYVLILLSLAIFGSIFSIINRYNCFWKENTISQVILESIEVFSEMMFMICNFLGALRHSRNWNKIFHDLNKVDIELDTKKLTTNIEGYWYTGKILLYHLAYLFLHAYELLMWTEKSSQDNEYGYILYRIIMYYQFYITLFAIKIIDVVHSRFLDLQGVLEDVSSKRIIIISRNQSDNSVEQLLKLRQLYAMLFNTHRNVNLIFRYSIFYGTLSNILIVLGDLNSIVQFAHTNDENFNIGVSFIGFLYSLFYSSALVSIVISCDRLESAGRKIVTTCYLYRDVLEKTMLANELVLLAEYMKNLTPTFSAAGFFQVNQQLLSTLMSAIITYFIIIIQFNLKF